MHTLSRVRSLALALVQRAITWVGLLRIHQCLAALMFCVTLLRMPLFLFSTRGSDPLDLSILPTRKGTQHGTDAYIAAVMLWALCIFAVHASKMQFASVTIL
jgi:hypothetical protein